MGTIASLQPAIEERSDLREHMRLVEALLFAALEPLDEATLAERLPDGADVAAALLALQADYAARGVNLVRLGGRWAFRTADDLAWLLSRDAHETRKLSRAAMETLAIIAYHQPVTRAEIEEIRSVSISKGTLDVLLETGWVRMRGRRRSPAASRPASAFVACAPAIAVAAAFAARASPAAPVSAAVTAERLP